MVLQPLPNIGNTTLDPIRPMLSPNDVYDLLVCMSPLYTFLYFPMVSGCVWKQGINDNDENLGLICTGSQSTDEDDERDERNPQLNLLVTSALEVAAVYR